MSEKADLGPDKADDDTLDTPPEEQAAIEEPDTGPPGCCMLLGKDLRAMTFFVFAIVFGEIVLLLLEASALSANGDVETAVNVSSQYVTFFRVAFSFLNTGVLAMLGMVKIIPSDPPEAQHKARRSAGKIVQMGTIVALLGGIACWMLINHTYDYFMKHFANKEQSAIDLAQDYVDWVSPALIANFLNNVFRSFYMQTGNLGLVMMDIALDLVVFAVLVLAWVKNCEEDEIAKALGMSNFIVAYFKTIIYLGYGLRPSFVSQFGFFSCSTEGLGGLYSKLGSDILWQSMATIATALSAFLATVIVNQFNNNEVLSVSAATCTVAMLSLPAGIYGYFITWKGSEYVLLHRYDKFQGLAREAGYVTLVLTLLINTLYVAFKGTCADSLTNDLDRDEVNSYLDDYHVAVIICGVFTSFKLLYSNIFVACGYYKQNALATTAVQVGIALSLGCIGWAADNLPTFYVGAYTLPAIILSTWMGWYSIKRIKPVQDEYFVNVMGGEAPPLVCCQPCAPCERACCPCLFGLKHEESKGVPSLQEVSDSISEIKMGTEPSGRTSMSVKI